MQEQDEGKGSLQEKKPCLSSNSSSGRRSEQNTEIDGMCLLRSLPPLLVSLLLLSPGLSLQLTLSVVSEYFTLSYLLLLPLLLHVLSCVMLLFFASSFFAVS